MSRHVVIGTAGHVDHGKTALVKALTGVDTDRWEEEKRRGITIDLGFAELSLEDGTDASIVDVPGHEDFVRNMVAGATGVDVALLVIAADEGVMPQTSEHVAILEFLQVASGAIAVTKSDLVEPDWLELVLDDVQEQLAGGGIVWEPPVAVSVKTGEGLAQVRAAISEAAERAKGRSGDEVFRMPVDRVFSVPGAGTVVTGTTWSGAVRPGDEVLVLPAGAKGRVRGVEVHGRPTEVGLPGRRTAIALAGVDRGDAIRGSTVVREAGWRASRRIDVHVSLLPTAKPLTQRSRIRLHLGTAEVMARVTPASSDIEPGGTGVVRLRLESPVTARWGDRGVLRSYSPVTTVGGCVVIDPFPDPRPRRPSADPDRQAAEPERRVPAFVKTSRRGLPVADLPIRLGFGPEFESVGDHFSAAGIVEVGQRLYPIAFTERVAQAAVAAVGEHHVQYPLQPGLPLEAFRRVAGGPAISGYVRSVLEAEGRIEVEAGAVRLTGHTPTLDGADAKKAERVEQALAEAGAHGVLLAELQKLVGAGDALELAEHLVRTDAAVRIGGDRYYQKTALDKIVKLTVDHLGRVGEAAPSDFREVLGLSRKYLIPLLEWLDGQRITERAGDVRRLGPGAPVKT